jgi:chromosomal replication initiation ATPase DnaA
MRVSERLAQDEAAARLAASVAGYALGVPPEKIIGDARGSADAAFARHVAAYLCHTAFEWSLSRIAAAFGRDRSTMAHACHAIEDKRDEAQFDVWIGALETMLREAPPRLRASA